MIVRLLRPWKFWNVGRILAECPDGTANMLIKRGMAERVVQQAQVSQADKERVKRERVRG